MKRRNFIKLSLFTPLILKLNANDIIDINPKHLATIDSITNIIFPKNENFINAKELHIITYMINTISHKSFNKDKKTLFLEGIKEFYSLYPDFINEDENKKNEILKSINETWYGNSWLDLLIYLSIEASFSDPIYYGNYEQKGWNNYNITPGYPRPKQRYGKLL